MKLAIPQPKLLLGSVIIASAALAFTYWWLTPHHNMQDKMAFPALPTLQVGNASFQVTGNIFNASRQLETQVEQSASVEPEKEQKTVRAYQLLATLLHDTEKKAIFVSGAEKLILQANETLPEVGIVTNIERNKVVILTPDGSQQEWLLFPTGNHDKLKDSEKQ